METINLRESLLKLDSNTCNQYDLTTIYDSCSLSDKDKGELVEMICNNEDAEVIYHKLSSYLDDDDISDMFISDIPVEGKYDIVIHKVEECLKEDFDNVRYNTVSNEYEFTKDDTGYTVGCCPVEQETEDYEVYIDGNFDNPICFDTEKDCVSYIVDYIKNKIFSTDISAIDDDDMIYVVYDIVEDEDRLTAKCMNESTNDFQDIKLGKINTDSVNKLLNNLLNNPNYKITKETKDKIYKNSAPWGLAVQMTSAVDVDGTNGLLSTGDFGGEASFGESIETNFEKEDRVTDGDRQGTVLDYDSQKVLVEWDYSEIDDIEWVDKSTLELVNEINSKFLPNMEYCPACGGTRFNTKTGVCIDCGYNERDWGITGADDDFDESIDGFDDRVGLIKRIDKYMTNTPNAEVISGYISPLSSEYKEKSSIYGDYVTTPFINIPTDTLKEYARKHKLLEESKNIIATGKEARKYLWNKLENSKDIKGYWKIEDDFINGGDITVIKDVSDVPNGYKYRFSFLDEVGKTPVEMDAYNNDLDWYIVDYLSDVKLEESVSGRYVWFDYNDIKEIKPQQIIDAYNDKYPDYDNPVTGIKEVEFAGRSYPEKELHYIVTDTDGNQFRAIVGNVSKDMLDTVQESLEENDEDGWGDRVEQILEPTIRKVEDLAYEVRNTVRGANTNCDTTDELADYVDEVIEDFEDANSSLRHEAQEIDESKSINEDALDDQGISKTKVDIIAKQAPNSKFYIDKNRYVLGKDLLDYFNTNEILTYSSYETSDGIRVLNSYKIINRVVDESKSINEDLIELNFPSFNELRKQYKNYTTFKDKEKNSGLIRDLCDQLENKKVSYNIYNHKGDNGMTIFYDDCELVEALAPYKKEEFKKQLQDELYDKMIKLFYTPEWGYENIKEIDEFINPVIEIEDYKGEYDNDIKVEFRAELNYPELEEICNVLDKVIQKYDKQAYFEPVEGGIADAYLKFPKRLKEDFEDDEIVTGEQEFDSAATSINSNKLPAVYSMVDFTPGQVVIDFGGGKFDNAVNYLKDKDVTLLVYDPYNRSAEHNKEVLRLIRENGGADAAINSNVLNVIKEPEARQQVLRNIKKLVKPGAPIYITVYEGSGKGNEGPTKSGYQLNRKTADYMDEISQVFSNVKRRGKLITAINESVAESYREDRKRLKDKIISTLEFLDTFKDIYKFPETILGDSWDDLKSGILMGVDTAYEEIAQTLVDYLEPSVEFDKRHPELLDEDPVAANALEEYENLKSELKESYSGAFDIEDDQYFTKEEIVGVAEKVCEHLDETYPDKFDIADVYMETPTIIHVEVISKEGNWASANAKIDMRKIKKPSDIMKYDVVIGTLVYNLRLELDDLYGDEYMRESLSDDKLSRELQTYLQRLFGDYVEVESVKYFESPFGEESYTAEINVSELVDNYIDKRFTPLTYKLKEDGYLYVNKYSDIIVHVNGYESGVTLDCYNTVPYDVDMEQLDKEADIIGDKIIDVIQSHEEDIYDILRQNYYEEIEDDEELAESLLDIEIDMWYDDDPKDVTSLDVRFSDLDSTYSGNLYINNKIVGDYTTKDSVTLEKAFPQFDWKAYWDAE